MNPLRLFPRKPRLHPMCPHDVTFWTERKQRAERRERLNKEFHHECNRSS